MADKVLEEVRVQIVDDLEGPVIKQLLDDLREKKVLNKGEVESILEENPSRGDKARKLVDSVKNKGSDASKIFIAQLKIRDEHFYNKLKLGGLLQSAGVNFTPGAPTPGASALGASDKQLIEPDDGSSKEYTMNSVPRGLCVIINNVKYENPKKNREGSKIDADGLKKVFTYLGFTVRTHEDQTAKQMRELMLSYSKTEKHGDCFVCCILSHGKQEGVIGTDMRTCSTKDILSPFDGINCPPLAGKPKVFFIQACRGKNRQTKVHVTADDDATEGDDDTVTSDDPGEAYTLPKHSDYLVSTSTVEDYVSYRNKYGSWFIESLCSKLVTGSQRGDDIRAILTEVSDEVSRREGIELVNEVECDAKMTPEQRYTLRKKLIFRIP
uniref:Caspase-8 n=1 Tax=Astyanax mexicanus TaxID=7994 RepID=A0A8B9LM57_ASTMX